MFSGKEFQSLEVLGIKESRYKFVLDLGICILFCDLRFRWLTWWTLGGTKFCKYWGAVWCTILWKVIKRCLYLRVSKLSHPASSRIVLFEHDLVAPVTIIAASIWIFSSSFFSYCVQLSQIISAYSKIGRINEKYMVCKVERSSWYFNFRSMLILFHALGDISLKCSCQEHVLLKTNPRCLWEMTFFISVSFMYKGGWAGGTAFLDIINSSVLFGLKFTNQVWDHKWILSKSAFINSAAVVGSCTIKYNEVSSAKSLILDPISLTISFM